jgi:hypothetical protein
MPLLVQVTMTASACGLLREQETPGTTLVSGHRITGCENRFLQPFASRYRKIHFEIQHDDCRIGICNARRTLRARWSHLHICAITTNAD